MGKVFKLRNGTVLLSTEAPGGLYNATQLKKIAALADTEAAVVKATEDQRLALFVAPENTARIQTELKSAGLGVRNYQDGLHQPVNCIGMLCGEHLQDALGASMEIQQALAQTDLKSPLKIGINGCARCCVATHTLDISVIGDSNGYRISLGGKNSQIPEMASFMAEGVPADKLPMFIGKVVTLYRDLAQDEETLQEVMDRCGTSKFIAALAPYSQDAAGADDPFGAVGEEPADQPVESDAGELTIEDSGLDDGGTEILAVETDDSGFAVHEPALDDGDLNVNVEDLNLDDSAGFIGDDVASTGVDISPADLASGHDMDSDVLISDGAGDLSMEDVSLDDVTDAVTDTGLPDSDDVLEIGEESSSRTAVIPQAPVTAKPVSQTPITDGEEASADLMDAEEVGESEADEFEQKLNNSIAEEESMPVVEDANSDDRMAAMRLVESGDDVPLESSVEDISDGFEESTGEATVEGVPEDFENLEVDKDSADLNAGELDIDLSPEVFEEDVATITPMALHQSGGTGFVGVEHAGNGRISVNFGSGMSILIDPAQVTALRSFTAFGSQIRVSASAQSLTIDVDGLSIMVPKRAA